MHCTLCGTEQIKGSEFIFADEVYTTRDSNPSKAKHTDDRVVVNKHGDFEEIIICSVCLLSIGLGIANIDH